MGGVLESVLKYKAQKDAQNGSDLASVGPALMAFQNAKTAAHTSLIQDLTTKIAGAKQGLAVDTQTGMITPDAKLSQANGGNILLVGNDGEVEVAGQFNKHDKTFKKSRTPEEVKEIEDAKFAGDTSTVNRSSDLRKELQGREDIKDFITIKNQVSAMEALASDPEIQKNPSRIAKDQGIITLFNKVTDPQSVVRESEYARTEAGQSLPHRFEGAFQKIQKGGAGITPQDIEALVEGAKIIANSRGESFNKTYDQYDELARGMKADSKLVLGGLTRHTPFELGSKKKGSVALPDGITEEDIQATMKSNKLTREEVLKRIS